jgi:hypothetical protein
MNPPRAPHARHVRYSVRHQARLDAETSAKLEVLASTFHRKRPAILRFVMQWGLRHSEGWTIDRSPVVAVSPVPILLEPELFQQVQEAAAAHSASVACWLRHVLQQINLDDFPPSWRIEETTVRSHESSYYFRKYQLRLDEASSAPMAAPSPMSISRMAPSCTQDYPAGLRVCVHPVPIQIPGAVPPADPGTGLR